MKQLILILVLFISTNLIAQEDISINICGASSVKNVTKKTASNTVSISQKKLLECLEISTNKKNWKVSSFTLGMTVGKDYLSINTKGNTINKKMVEAIKKHNPEKIYIEKITVNNSSDEALRMGALTIEIN